MPPAKYTQEFLQSLAIRDSATLIGSYDILQTSTPITFKCVCGEETTKKLTNFIYGKHPRIKCYKCCRKDGTKEAQETNIKRFGVKNPQQSEIVKAKTIETNLKKYGVPHVLQHPSIKEKIKKTIEETYGVSNPMYVSSIKDKIKATFLSKYGVDNPMKTKEHQKKLEETSLKRYGTRRPSSNLVILKKIQASHLAKTDSERELIKQKVKETCLEKYGVESTNMLDSVKDKKKDTCLLSYGVTNHMQSAEIQAKIQNRGFRRKEFKMPSGDIRIVQGFEPYALKELLKDFSEDMIKTNRVDIPRIIYTVDNKNRYYFPDVYIPHINKIIEVKSTWTYKCTTDNIHIKGAACKAAGYLFEIWVYNGKGVRILTEVP